MVMYSEMDFSAPNIEPILAFENKLQEFIDKAKKGKADDTDIQLIMDVEFNNMKNVMEQRAVADGARFTQMQEYIMDSIDKTADLTSQISTNGMSNNNSKSSSYADELISKLNY